jgi:hypothetical protein
LKIVSRPTEKIIQHFPPSKKDIHQTFFFPFFVIAVKILNEIISVEYGRLKKGQLFLLKTQNFYPLSLNGLKTVSILVARRYFIFGYLRFFFSI